jgi:hypothetical protein
VHNPEEAYQVAVALEQAEIRGIMDCLFERSNLNGEWQALLRRQILNHQAQVISGLPAMYDSRVMRQEGLPRWGHGL